MSPQTQQIHEEVRRIKLSHLKVRPNLPVEISDQKKENISTNINLFLFRGRVEKTKLNVFGIKQET